VTVDVGDTLPKLVGSHPSVIEVTLAGSRARGDATRWSDWDFNVATADFPSLAHDLPSLVEPLRPIATLWDPLADDETFMIILDGPIKIDLIFDVSREQDPPHVPSAQTLSAIDAHFWDWTLWLTSKVAHGKTDLVRAELEKMTWYLLGPLGVSAVPRSLPDAVDAYRTALGEQERRFGASVPRELAAQVTRVVREQGAEPT
jgi:hypothetical protein